MPDNQIEGQPKRLSQTSLSSALVFLKYFHLNQIEGSSFVWMWGWVPESNKGVDHWIIGAKLPQPPNHNNSLTPPPHSPQFTKVHQLKFPLHYTSERRIVGLLVAAKLPHQPPHNPTYLNLWQQTPPNPVLHLIWARLCIFWTIWDKNRGLPIKSTKNSGLLRHWRGSLLPGNKYLHPSPFQLLEYQIW